jgi:hypothetical protein
MSALLIVGCASKPQERVVIKSEIKVVKIPESILTPCEVTAPPAKAVYLALTPQKKEAALTDYILDLHRDLRLCNIQVKKIKEFQDKELNAFKEIESK